MLIGIVTSTHFIITFSDGMTFDSLDDATVYADKLTCAKKRLKSRWFYMRRGALLTLDKKVIR